MTKPSKAIPRRGTNDVAPSQDEAAFLNARARRAMEGEAAVKIAQTRLAKVGLEVQIDGDYFDSVCDMHAVNIRIYIPQLDIDAVIEGDHVDGITLETP